MKEIKNEDLGQEVFDLFDSYVHSKISRRDFMDRVSKYAVGGLTVGAILEYLSPKYASAQQVRAGDPRLDEQYIEYSSPKGGGTIRGLLSTPADNEAKLGLIKVVPIAPAHAITIECYRPRVGLSRHKQALYERIIAGPDQDNA